MQNIKNKKKFFKILFFTVFLLIFFISYSFSLSGKVSKKYQLEVNFLDVGHGDSILIKTLNNNILIDSGDTSCQTEVYKYLKKHNVNEINLFLITHQHIDHMGGALNILENFKVNNIMMPAISELLNEKDNYFYNELILKIKEKNINLLRPVKNEKFYFDDAEFEILSDDNKESNNLNNYSIISSLNYLDYNFLFMGDAEKEDELEFLNYLGNKEFKVDVLKVGHHGSLTSTTNELLDKIKPDFSVISSGITSTYNLPSSKIISRLKEKDTKILRTDFNGEISFFIENSVLRYKTQN